MTQRWKHRPPGSNWGEFGPDDQLGRLNLLTAAKIKEGVAEVREGLAFCLSMPLDYPGGVFINPVRHPPIVRPTVHANGEVGFVRRSLPDKTDIVCDDMAVIHLQYSSQWDSLAHVGQLFDADGDGVAEPVFYNGYRGGEDIVAPADASGTSLPPDLQTPSAPGARKLGIENMAVKCVQGRGVMIDIHAHFGDENRYVSYDDLMMVMAKDEVVVEPGDMVCLHTGYGQGLLDAGKKPDLDAFRKRFAGLDGRDERLLQWITDSGVAILISDNRAVELLPPRDVPGTTTNLPLHAHCLFKLGIHLGEFWYLTELANWLRANRRNRFLLTAPPLRLPGAVGSPPSPIATV